jgi:hypothetical protein
VFTTDLRAPIRRTAFSARVWRPAVKAAGLPASAAETLDTYSHLWPDSDDRTRAAVDSVLRTAEDC